MTKKGFTLIELMIVVAIIAIIAAIAIPNLLASRKAANQSSTVGTLRALYSAEEQFRILKRKASGTQYGSLQELKDNKLFSGIPITSLQKAGYIYVINAGTQFTATASPATLDEGDNVYGLWSSGSITYNTGTAPAETDAGID